ncbi:MAG TPA: ferritin family protein [Phycisphaerae bacterium]|nr:ferritin family protein [Phycisphaerae bacterium]
MAKSVRELTEREVLALAIDLEETDSRTYGDIADALREKYPATAETFVRMAEEEAGHRRKLTAMYREKFGDELPGLKRGDVEGFAAPSPVWLEKGMSVESVRKRAEEMEAQTRRFYQDMAEKTQDLRLRELLHELAEAEAEHIETAGRLAEQYAPEYAREQHAEDERERKRFVLEIIQPGLAGLMDGSVSTLAPIFAAAFATHNNWDAFRVGLAASIGAGISMGFAEALSDDGRLSGRGKPLIRGAACGLMTTAGGIGHTLPYLVPQRSAGDRRAFLIATLLALGVVAVELGVISWIRHRYMRSPWVSAAIQVVIGGIIVLVAGILIGS